ncbi:serine protease Do-like protein HtrB [Salinibacillus aidingensis]|uniref:Serine protease Do-like protein HtrB n=2 Tax=Salinibacillus aidingensis TaxID=237684 RepID=A0ABN1B1T1_9BACI
MMDEHEKDQEQKLEQNSEQESTEGEQEKAEQPPEQQSVNQPNKEKPKRGSRLKSMLMTVSAGMIGSVLTLTAVTQVDGLEQWITGNNQEAVQEEAAGSSESTSASASPNVQQINATGSSVTDIVDQASEAIVGVVNISKQNHPFLQNAQQQKTGTGSGVIYKVTDNAAYIVTNNHVVEGANEIEVTLHNDKTKTAELVGRDALTDTAVLKISGEFDIKPLSFGDSDSLQTGEQVIAIGNPLGLELSRTVTQGIVSAVDRSITVNTSAGEWDLEVIQTDAAINPGNSGGALIDSNGKLVGINSLKISNQNVEGLGFAIPSNKVQSIVDELMKNGKVERPYLGVKLLNVNEIPSVYRQKESIEVNQGVIIAGVQPNTPAAKAGLQKEDIIVAVDGEKITDVGDLRKYLYSEHSIGDEVTIEVNRGGEMQKVDLTLTSNEQQ